MKAKTFKTFLLFSACSIVLFITPACNNNSISIPNPENKTHGIIPLPRQLEFSGEKLIANGNFTLVNNSTFKNAFLAAEELLETTLESHRVSDAFSSGDIGLLFIDDNSIAENAYELTISAGGIRVKAGNDEGAFWAIQTLKQYFWNLNNRHKVNSIEIPGIHIFDEPKYEWRGFHLDVSRHMFTVEYIKKVIDWLAYYKFNKLHLHLTDDQGWRLESKKFPLLNEIGSWRTFDRYDSICMQKALSNADFTIDPRFIQIRNGKTMYGGFYSNKEIAGIVNYAKTRCIEIIPEVDMPGHMSAAIKAYPFLSCAGAPGWGTEFSYPICPCNDDVYDFAFQVYDEISGLFPSDYFHIGADEVEKDTWKQSEDCKDFIKKNNLTSVNEIQSLFVERIRKHLESKGKTVIVWDDATDGKMDSNLRIMYWRDWVKDAPDKAAANGNQIVFTRWDLFYLSSDNSAEALKKLFEFDIQKEYSQEVRKKIIGFQGCVWTEEIPSEAVFESQIFPRLQALSEVNWSGTKDWNSFTHRLSPHLDLLNFLKVNVKYFPFE